VYGPDNRPLAQVAKSGGAAIFLHTDQIGSISLTTKTDGAAGRSYTYSLFGARSAISGAGTDSKLLFNGQYLDMESRAYYLRGRFYDPASAQFLTKDPMVDQTGEPYSYAGNDPLNSSDPTGLFSIPGTGLCVDIADSNCTSFLEQWGEDHPDAARHVVNLASGVSAANPVTMLTDLCGITDTQKYADKSSGWYLTGLITMTAVDAWMGVGTQARSLRDSPLVGKESQLFARGGKNGGLLNRTTVRMGWSWKGPWDTGQDVFRIGIGNSKKYHVVLWEDGRATRKIAGF
jgi:RHS repeat-associated protein